MNGPHLFPLRSDPGGPRPEPERLPGNGVDGESGSYLFPAMTPDEALELARGSVFPPGHADELRWQAQKSQKDHLGPGEGVDPANLAEAGWGVLFAPGVQPEVKRALEPLLDLRRQQAGERFKPFVYKGESKPRFLAGHGAGPGPVNPENIPYYLLLVGGPEEISFEFQYQLDVQYAVGRLHFDGPDRLEQYARYARSVIEAENGGFRPSRRVVLFAPRNPNDRATELTHDHLVRPLGRELSERLRNGPQGWEILTVLGPDARKERLLELLGGGDKPSLLLTASHGVGFPGSPEQQVAQGALLCQDWEGPGSMMSPGCFLSARDISPEIEPHGLLAFHFACYSAGTPAANNFVHRGPAEPAALAPTSFIARLPQSLLGHPKGGALAVVGHVDRAWGYSFSWPLAGEQIEVFASAFLRLLKGQRLGWAMELFNLKYAELASDVLQPLVPQHEDLLHPSALWTALLDARNYIILGDPAVRLPAAAFGDP